MKKSIILIAIACIAFAGCKKDSVTTPLASISFVNAIAGSSPIIPKLNGTSNGASFNFSTLSSSNKVNYGTSTVLPVKSGNVSAVFIQSTDTLNTVFNTNLNLQGGGVYSLYLAGTPAATDSVFIQEQLPTYALTDSIAGIRFINLSPGNTISIDIKGQANGSEVASLTYKARTSFKTYNANYKVPSYIFEFRNASTGALLTTYTLSGVNNGATSSTVSLANTVRRRNNTIALIGGGTVTQSVILIANY